MPEAEHPESDVKHTGRKVALVSGGDAGAGFEAARSLAAAGAHVFISGRVQRELDDAAARIGCGASALRGDPANLGDVDHVLGMIRRQAGRLDMLVIDVCSDGRQQLKEVTEAEFDRNFNTHVRGLLFTVQTALPLLADGASIFLLCVGVCADAWAGYSVSGATQAAVNAFALAWSEELKHRGIRVVCSAAADPTLFAASLLKATMNSNAINPIIPTVPVIGATAKWTD